jgi:Rrf2 family protein
MRLELTRRGDYAVRTMIFLARSGAAIVPADRIAGEMGIPSRFTREVLHDLDAAGLVKAMTGRSGGYRLVRPAESVSLLEVIEAVEGDSRRRTCVLRGAPCGQDGFCDVHRVFFEAQEALLARLAATTVAALAVEDGHQETRTTAP